MRLREFFAEDAINLQLQSTTKDDVLKELVGLLQLDDKSEQTLVKMLKRRETLGSTGIGQNIAIPHCRALAVNRLRVAFGRKLDGIALAHEGEPWPAWKNAVVEWHVQTLARVRAESWIPGMAGEQDPMVERALSRFSSYHMRTTIARLREENTALQRKLVDAVTCARFYAAGATDAGACARSVRTR